MPLIISLPLVDMPRVRGIDFDSACGPIYIELTFIVIAFSLFATSDCQLISVMFKDQVENFLLQNL